MQSYGVSSAVISRNENNRAGHAVHGQWASWMRQRVNIMSYTMSDEHFPYNAVDLSRLGRSFIYP